MADQGAGAQSPPHDVQNDTQESARSQKSKFRFKSSKRRSRHDEDYSGSRDHRGRRRPREYSRSKRRKSSASPSETQHPDSTSENHLDPDAAFRESLFDAMADDEGAQFWEGVYGQPIPKVTPIKTTQAGITEAMTDDEYAAYIMAEMYKRSRQYLLEQKRRNRQAQKEKERLDRNAQAQDEAESFSRRVDESLRRGKERKEKAKRSWEWAEKWKDYEISWRVLAERRTSGPIQIPWPMWHRRMENINQEAIEEFFLNGPTSGNPTEADLCRTLKSERVRWHPDKVQQKLGEGEFSKTRMQAVTAVFQIIDRMWTELRDKKN